MTAVAIKRRRGKPHFASHDSRGDVTTTLAPAAHSSDVKEALLALQKCRICTAFVLHGTKTPFRLISMPRHPSRYAA